MTLTRVLVDGLTACVPFSIVVWASFSTMPRLWLHSLPPDIQALLISLVPGVTPDPMLSVP